MNDVGTGTVLGVGLDAGLAIRFWWETGMSLEVELCFYILFISPLPPPHNVTLHFLSLLPLPSLTTISLTSTDM